MNIASPVFLFLFFPISILLYFIIPARKTMLWKNIYLLIISIIFYAYGEPFKIILIVIMTLITWLLGIMAYGRRNTKVGKWAVALTVIMNVGMLFFYKYVSGIMEGLGYVFHTELPSLKFALPLGLSFFCFSSISYVVDIYRGKIKDQKNLSFLAFYFTNFLKKKSLS